MILPPRQWGLLMKGPYPDQDMAGIRLLVVDDHRMVAQGLELGLSRESDIEVVGVAGAAETAISMTAELQPDVVLMDYHLGEASGAAAAAAMRAASSALKIVFLSADESDEALLAAVEAGACGYLLKSEPIHQIAASVRRAHEGEILLSPATLVALMARQRQRNREKVERDRATAQITAREREVLSLMSEGLDNKTIAQDMHISLTTVRWYVQNILEKLESHSKLEAVARAGELGLLER